MRKSADKSNANTTTRAMGGGKSLMVAALLGFIAFVLFWAHGQRSKRELITILGSKQEVIVAAGEILPGREISIRQIRTENLHAMTIQPGALTSADRVVNRIAQVPIKEGQQILETLLYEESGGYLSLRIDRQESKRAITLNMDGEGALAGLITPGDHVDVMGVFESAEGAAGGEGQPKNHALILAQSVKVLAIDNVMSEYSMSAPTDSSWGGGDHRSGGAKNSALVTLEVSPEQAWELGLAAQIAHLRCLLRHRLNIEDHRFLPQASGAFPSIDSQKAFGAGGVTIQVMRPVDGNLSP